MFHGGNEDFRQFDFLGIRNLTAGKPIIVVMPDGGHAGWYSNPVSSFVGPRNWETFHIAQLIPWIEANFRTFAEYDGRAVGGFSMGGFGALKYAAKYYGHFASVSSHSGPASLRRDFGLVVHWANFTSAVLDLAGATVYGVPNWDQARVSADNPVERIESYRNKRIFLVAGTSPDPLNWFDSVKRPRCLPASGSSANASAPPASRMNRMRCPAATSSGPTCSSSTSTASSPGCATPAVLRLGVPPTPTRTWRPTNCIESTISVCRGHAGNVKRWRAGHMALRWALPAHTCSRRAATRCRHPASEIDRVA